MRGHFSEVRALAAEQRLHAAVAVGLAGSPCVNVFGAFVRAGFFRNGFFRGGLGGDFLGGGFRSLLFGSHRV
jgi:hypothetical protein